MSRMVTGALGAFSDQYLCISSTGRRLRCRLASRRASVVGASRWARFKVEREDRRRDQVVFACVWAADQATRSARNVANGSIFESILALSSAFRYRLRSSTRTTVHGYPPDANIVFIRKRAILPLPSM